MSTAREFIQEVTRMSNEIHALEGEVRDLKLRHSETARDHLLTAEKLREYKEKLWAAARGCGDRVLKISVSELDLLDPDQMILVEWRDKPNNQHCIRADVKQKGTGCTCSVPDGRGWHAADCALGKVGE